MNKFSIKSAFGEAWSRLQANFLFLFKALLILYAVAFLPDLLTELLRGQESISASALIVVVQLTSIVLGIILMLGFTYLIIAVKRDKELDLRDLLSQRHQFWRFIGTAIVIGFLVFVPLLLLIGLAVISLVAPDFAFGADFSISFFPGLLLLLGIFISVYLGVRLQFWVYALVDDEQSGVRDALKTTWEITRGRFWKLLAFDLVVAGVQMLGVMALFVGTFVSVPLTMLAMTEVYDRLRGSLALDAQPIPRDVQTQPVANIK